MGWKDLDSMLDDEKPGKKPGFSSEEKWSLWQACVWFIAALALVATYTQTHEVVYVVAAFGCFVFTGMKLTDATSTYNVRSALESTAKPKTHEFKDSTDTDSYFEVASFRGKCTYYGGTGGPLPPPPPPPPPPTRAPTEWFQRAVTPQE